MDKSPEYYHYVIAVAVSLLTALSQILVKTGALRWKGGNVLGLYLNPWTISGYGFFFIVTLLNLYVFKYIPLNTQMILLPLTLVSVVVASRWVFQEKLTGGALVGACIIMLGIAIYGYGMPKETSQQAGHEAKQEELQSHLNMDKQDLQGKKQ